MTRCTKFIVVTAAIVLTTALVASGRADIESNARNEAAFNARNVDELLDILRARGAEPSDAIEITLPRSVENTNLVPMVVVSHIDGTESIAVIVDNNSQPLAANFRFDGAGIAHVSFRLRLDRSSEVRVLVKARGRYFVATRAVHAGPTHC